MNVFALTRALVDIESITNNEERVGDFLFDAPAPAGRALSAGASSAWRSSRAASTCSRSGASRVVTLSTHMDTVPPFFASREDDEYIWGARRLRHQGHHRLHDQGRRSAARSRRAATSACCSWWARSATAPALTRGRAARRAARATSSTASPPKTSWRSAPRARCATRSWPTGRMAHSAYPELGDSAIHKLLDALDRIRRIPLPVDRAAGPEHAEHRHDLRRPRAQRDRRRGARRDHDPPGGRFAARPRQAVAPRRRRPRRSCARCSKFRRSGWARWTASKPPWWPSPPISRRSAARGASRS